MFSRGSAQRGLGFESLEDRSMLTAYFVNTIADDPLATATDTDGVVSLREAIQAARTNAIFGDATAGDGGGATDTISFNGALNGQTIVLGGALSWPSRPHINHRLGTGQFDDQWKPNEPIVLDRVDVAADISGLTITAGELGFAPASYAKANSPSPVARSPGMRPSKVAVGQEALGNFYEYFRLFFWRHGVYALIFHARCRKRPRRLRVVALRY